MVTFYCDGCSAVVCFESVTCVACSRALEVITAARGMRSGPRMMAGCPA